MNRGSRYRRNNRKRKTKKIIIISISAVLILFVIFMVSGLFLSEKVKENAFTATTNNQGGKIPQSEQVVPSVNAYPLAILEDGSSFNSRFSAVSDVADQVCVSLNTPQGELLFKSTVASHFSDILVKSDASALSGYTDTLQYYEIYSTALLYMKSPTDAELVSNVYSSIWSSIACEAIRAGINDVLLVSNASVDEVDKLCTLADSIHLTEENAVVGITVPQQVLEDENYVELINSLAKSFDYLAINATELETNDRSTLLEAIEATIGNFQDQIIYHKMRVLLPNVSTAEEQSAFVELLAKYAITNWQISPNKA